MQRASKSTTIDILYFTASQRLGRPRQAERHLETALAADLQAAIVQLPLHNAQHDILKPGLDNDVPRAELDACQVGGLEARIVVARRSFANTFC